MPNDNFVAVVHGLDYLAALLLFGVQFFEQFISGSKSQSSSKYFLIALFTSTIWLLLSATDMAGSWSFNKIWFAMSETTVGFYSCVRNLILLCGFVLSIIGREKRNIRFILLGLAGIAPLFSTLISHAAMSETHTNLRTVLDFVHVTFASIWVGGLFALYISLGRSAEPYSVVKRFSLFAMASTGLILFTGVVQLYFTFATLSDLWTTIYGKLALSKLVLFFMALAAAGLNHFMHLRNWRAGNDLMFIKNIKRELKIEMFLLLILVGVTSFLTRTNLPGE